MQLTLRVNQRESHQKLQSYYNVSEPIRRLLASVDVQTCFQPYRALRGTFVHSKDPNTLSKRKGVVYIIVCGTCYMRYVGKTERTLEIRLSEYQRVLSKGVAMLSAVVEHSICHLSPHCMGPYSVSTEQFQSTLHDYAITSQLAVHYYFQAMFGHFT